MVGFEIGLSRTKNDDLNVAWQFAFNKYLG